MKLSTCYRVHSVSPIFTFLSVTQMVLSTVPLPCVSAVTKNETLSIFNISALFSTPVAYQRTTCFTAISWLNLCTFHHSLKYSSNAVWGTHWGGSLVWSSVLGRLKPVVHSVGVLDGWLPSAQAERRSQSDWLAEGSAVLETDHG